MVDRTGRDVMQLLAGYIVRRQAARKLGSTVFLNEADYEALWYELRTLPGFENAPLELPNIITYRGVDICPTTGQGEI